MLVEASNLCKRYGYGDAAICGLQAVSFGIERGEFMAIMGPSGSGKSTLMSLLGLLDQPSGGTLVLEGEETTRLSPDRLAFLRNSRIGFVFQAYNLLVRNTALENVELPLIYSGTPRRQRVLRAEAALAAVGLAHRMRHRPAHLSGGEQQRVAIARALVCDPAIILADEPTGALDSRTGDEILALLQRLHRQGRTIVLVTHDPRIAAHTDRVLRLQDGRIVGDEIAARGSSGDEGAPAPEQLERSAGL